MMIQLNQFKTSLKLERKAVLSLLIFPLFVCLQSRKTKNCKQILTSDTYEPYTCYTKNSHVSFITLFFYLSRDKMREIAANCYYGCQTVCRLLLAYRLSLVKRNPVLSIRASLACQEIDYEEKTVWSDVQVVEILCLVLWTNFNFSSLSGQCWLMLA